MSQAQTLAEICERHVLPEGSSVVVPEPYIPLIPETWNETLILAEAQNLSGKSGTYVSWLQSCSRDQRIRRLQLRDEVGVGPWDDGSFKLALIAALNVKPEETAVSNAVLWSQVTRDGNNLNPIRRFVLRSADLWAEMIEVLRPRTIIAAGGIAKSVMKKALRGLDTKPTVVHWILPAPRLLKPLTGMVGERDLLSRFSEVDVAAGQHPELLKGKNRKQVILYSCLAVSVSSNAA